MTGSRVRPFPLGVTDEHDPCELDAAAMAALEARMAVRPSTERQAGRVHAARFGAPTLAHYRAVYLQAGAPWPGEAFVRRHHPVAEPERPRARRRGARAGSTGDGRPVDPT